MEETAEKPKGKWRDDKKSKDQPTADAFVVCAQDLRMERDGFKLVILHVKSYPQGNGFVPSIRRLDDDKHEPVANGKVFPGIDEQAYEEAYQAGIRLLQDHLYRNRLKI